jgi:glutathione S-transferase
VTGFFHIAPRVVRPLVAHVARRQVRQTLHLHGLGRHTAAEQRGFAERDLQALEGAVRDREFLFGDTPNVFDFTVAGFMAGVYDNEPATWFTTLSADYRDLRAYTERVQRRVGVYGRPVP